MEPRAHHVLIGAFTVLVAILAVLFSLWLSKAGQHAGERHYVVIFHEAVRGLTVGSAVQYNGIKVGEVMDLSLNPQDPSEVRARIKVQDDIPIKEDTRARLVLTGITGASVIGLSGGSPESPDLPEPESGDPVIVATPSPITQLLANSDNLMTNLTSLVMSAQQVLSPENAERIGRSLENLERFTAALGQPAEDLSELVPALTQASRQAEVALEQATALMKRADNVLVQQGDKTFQSIRSAMVSIDDTGKSLNQLIEENRSGLHSGVDGLRQLGPALQELRTTLASLQDVVRKLDDSPTNFLLGRTKIEEFEP
ncbi:MAG TPA: MlaD family protein [Pusillimonas sp.]|uniref:MlaD family protein n=1 Tax=unclassified Pusillimonas TaxID=2640016 RepID=UPI002617E92F|nr:MULTISPECIES: MlaD family protein [unclassified Pusillimonas]HLU20665.1 MlaD family protein [Pusillimonas sp.]